MFEARKQVQKMKSINVKHAGGDRKTGRINICLDTCFRSPLHHILITCENKNQHQKTPHHCW